MAVALRLCGQQGVAWQLCSPPCLHAFIHGSVLIGSLPLCPPSLPACLQPKPAELGLEASAVPVPVVPVHSRTTTSGEACRLPTVYEVRLGWSWGCGACPSPV